MEQNKKFTFSSMVSVYIFYPERCSAGYAAAKCMRTVKPRKERSTIIMFALMDGESTPALLAIFRQKNWKRK